MWLCSLPARAVFYNFSVSLILCQSIKCDFVAIFQNLCSKRMDLSSWLLCGCQSLEAHDLTSVCKQSLIAKKDVNLAHVFFWHLGLLKACSYEKTQCLNLTDSVTL